MPELQNKAFYLSPEELNVLLIQSEITGIQLFEAVTKCDVDEISAAQAIVSLTEKGVLSENKTGFSLDILWKSIMSYIKDAEYTVVITSPQRLIPVNIVFYQSKNVVELQVDARGGKRIRVGIKSAEVFLEELLQTEAVPDQDAWLPEEEGLSGAYIPIETLKEDATITLTIERFPKGKTEPDYTICIKKESVSDWMILYRDKEQREIVLYNCNAFSEALRSMLDGEDVILERQEA